MRILEVTGTLNLMWGGWWAEALQLCQWPVHEEFIISGCGSATRSHTIPSYEMDTCASEVGSLVRPHVVNRVFRNGAKALFSAS